MTLRRKIAIALSSAGAGLLLAGVLAGPALAAPLGSATAQVHCNGQTLHNKKSNANEFTGIPSYNTSNYACTLQQGDSSDGVWRLQVTMNSCYGKTLATDGAFGPATNTALRQVQAALGLSADGIYGTQTRNSILWSASDLTCNHISSYVGF
ncbi:MAG: secreted peptidoglycan binding protein [Microbacteriaceae bacterium]|nr:secreted peptidoglycan binding protein [Microbacteriaceae bacterium]